MKNSSLRHALFSLLACVMLLAACSSGSSAPPGQAPGSNGGGDGPGAVALIRAVSGNVQDAGSYRATFEFVMGAQGRSFRASGDGEFSNDPLQAHVNYRFDGLPLAQGEMEMEMIIDGSVMYMRAPALTEGSMFATEWISMDLDELAPGFSDLAELSQGQNDPTAAVEYLRGIEDAEEIGTEDVAGVETTHYRGTIDLDSAYDRLPADARGELEQALAQARKQFGGVSMPVDVWIDSDGLLRRMTFIMKTGPGASMPLRMEMTMEIPEYGITLDLPIPEASDVTDLGDLASLSGGSGGWS